MKKEGYYQYQVFYVYQSKHDKGYVYEIYSLDKSPQLERESNEWFDTEQEASLAAIGHISLLENGEG